AKILLLRKSEPVPGNTINFLNRWPGHLLIMRTEFWHDVCTRFRVDSRAGPSSTRRGRMKGTGNGQHPKRGHAMKQHPMRAGGVLVSLFGLLCLAAPALGQGDDDNDNNNKAKKVGVHKLEIYNGELRTVHYFTDGLSEEERADVRDLQQAQNDVAFAQYNKGLAVQPIGPGFVRPVGFFGYGFGFQGSFGYGLPGFAGYAGY